MSWLISDTYSMHPTSLGLDSQAENCFCKLYRASCRQSQHPLSHNYYWMSLMSILTSYWLTLEDAGYSRPVQQMHVSKTSILNYVILSFTNVGSALLIHLYCVCLYGNLRVFVANGVTIQCVSESLSATLRNVFSCFLILLLTSHCSYETLGSIRVWSRIGIASPVYITAKGIPQHPAVLQTADTQHVDFSSHIKS